MFIVTSAFALKYLVLITHAWGFLVLMELCILHVQAIC